MISALEIKTIAAAVPPDDLGTVVGVGTVLELSMPRENPFKTVWLYYSNSDIGASDGVEVWLNFYNGGSLVLSIPVYIKRTATTVLGMAVGLHTIYNTATGGAYAGSIYAMNIAGPDVLFWNPRDTVSWTHAIHPIKVQVVADTARIIQSHAGHVCCLLGVLSHPNAN